MKRFVSRMVPAWVEAPLRRIQSDVRLRLAERAVASFRPGSPKRPHRLPGELIVSLTSHPPRFATLGKTLRGLLAQSVAADRLVLWLTEGDEKFLPSDVTELKEHGLTIETCEDMRSYAKIIPALRKWPDAFIVTADDDLYYEPKWLETLVDGAVPGERVIVCRRALRPRGTAEGYAPYLDWEWEYLTGGEIRDDLFPTGVGGVLYPPGSLAPEVLDVSTFKRICPTEDDMWLYWMGRRAGSKVRQVGGGFAQVTWEGSQSVSLLSTNIGEGRSDGQFMQVLEAFPEKKAQEAQPKIPWRT